MEIGRTIQSLTIGTVAFLRGYSLENVDAANFNWSYLRRDGVRTTRKKSKSEIIVVLHGFSSVKESMIGFGALLPEKYTIIIPDFPGHGLTRSIDPTKMSDEEICYRITEQVHRLNAFLHAVLDKEFGGNMQFHITGCSMGGLIAGMYAALYPQHVKKLLMLCPAGLSMPNKSKMLEMHESTGKVLLLAHTVEDVKEMLEAIMFKTFWIPDWFIMIIARQRRRNLPLLTKLLTDLATDSTLLEDHLHLIRAKTFVVWGNSDNILDVSCLEILQKKLTGTDVKYFHVFEECGHTVQHEKRPECVQMMTDFLEI